MPTWVYTGQTHLLRRLPKLGKKIKISLKGSCRKAFTAGPTRKSQGKIVTWTSVAPEMTRNSFLGCLPLHRQEDLKQILRQLGKKTVIEKQAQVQVPPLTGCVIGS